jgi:hypothetical protein
LVGRGIELELRRLRVGREPCRDDPHLVDLVDRQVSGQLTVAGTTTGEGDPGPGCHLVARADRTDVTQAP